MMLWADEANDVTVVNVMYQTSLEDFVIVGYVVDTESGLFEVYEIAANAVMEVKQTRLPRSDL